MPAVRRLARSLVRRRAVRRPAYRRKKYVRRRRFHRKRFLHTQNVVKYHCKQYDTGIMYPRTGSGTTFVTDVQTFQLPLYANAFFNGNQQFYKNLDEYHFIKFNYIAVHVKELNWIGYTKTDRVVPPEGGDPYPAVSGVTAMQMQNHPVYIMWDIEEDFAFDTNDKVQITSQQLAQYQGAKTLRTTSKKPVKFIWRFPVPWRQFYSCYNFKQITHSNRWGTVMEELSGIKNLRAPKNLLMCHPNWWGSSLPVNAALDAADFYGQYAIVYHLGVTFRGRSLMGSATSYAPPAQVTSADE
ncbi:putative capsid protein [Panicum ecklonii-associated virus]|uniref:putative capsid protein n=1 Tax=Panicum ecklonii-associated virus TaxID=2282645 RepID=UPI000DF5F5B6|nr:putative capsid protein [Panicum ecklonii-associated virus]AXF50877.1 putative capsid protein [Panicum ecklonii-associated virus]